jgi:hypothetical protein
MTDIDASSWRQALAGVSDPALTAVLIVQCGLDWLRPVSAALRDETDQAVTTLELTRPDMPIDRIILHNMPAITDLPPGELAELNEAHADWLCRLALTAAMLPVAARPRVHRLIVTGSQHSVGLEDGISLRVNGRWIDPDAAAAGLRVLGQAGLTTPLTGYDIDLNGPFGDADPSVYL